MQLDPRWITTRYGGTCSNCQSHIPKGTQAFYYPNGRKLYGSTCCGAAEEGAADFNAALFDQSSSAGQW